jgi:hypothetical protein
MRIVASQDPPVPPALEKKRQRWSLSLTDGAAAASDRLDHTSEGSRDGASGNGKSHLSNGSILPLDHCWQDPVDADTCAGRDNGLPVEIAADTVMGDSQ